MEVAGNVEHTLKKALMVDDEKTGERERVSECDFPPNSMGSRAI